MKSIDRAFSIKLILPVLLVAAFLMPAKSSAQVKPESIQNANVSQQEFTDKELKQFADASLRLMNIQRKGEERMLKILKEEKLEISKFNEMAQAHQQERLDEVKATAEEKVAFDKAAKRMIEMQPDLQKDVETAIVKEGMTLDKYEQIMTAYRQDPILQTKLNKLMEQ
jgi:aldehyde:ferredoxin oxidoreductase